MSQISDLSSACNPYSQNLGKPTIQFAEDNICGYIAQPANTWSNLAYLILALKIAQELRQANNKTLLWGFVPIFIFMGLASGFYHATATFVGQFFDFGSIYLFAAFILFLSLVKLKIWSPRITLILISLITLSLFILLWFVPVLRIWLFATEIIVFLIVEYRIHKIEKLQSKTKFKEDKNISTHSPNNLFNLFGFNSPPLAAFLSLC